MIVTEIITTPNNWRAERLAELVRSERVLVRHCWKTASGKVESACSIHPEFQSTMWHEHAYTREVRATLEALSEHLKLDAELRERGESQGITQEVLQEMIDSGGEPPKE